MGEASLQATQEQLARVASAVDDMKTRSGRETATFTMCINQLLNEQMMYHKRFIESFEACSDLAHEQEIPESEEQEDELEHLMVLCRSMEAQSSHVGTAFDRWAEFRAEADHKNQCLRLKVEELQQASELMRQR